MHLDSAVRDCRVFVKQWSSAAHSLSYLLQYSKKLSTSANNLLQAVQQAWSLHNSYRPPDALLKQLQRYAWLPSMCEAAMSLKDCCSRQQYAAAAPGQYSDAMEHADAAILALGSLLLAVLRWCNLSQLMHTAQQQGAPKGAAAFRELFEQVWCRDGVFLLANYTAVLVALLRQQVEVQQEQEQQQQQTHGKHLAKVRRQGRTSPSMPGTRQSPQLQKQQQQRRLGEQIQQLYLGAQQPAAQELQEQPIQSPEPRQHSQTSTPPAPKQHQPQHSRPPDASPAKHDRPRSTATPRTQQQQQVVAVAQLSMSSVWRNVQLPAAHRVWGPPNELAIWRRQGYGVMHSAAAELQLLLMLWGWAVRMASTLGLQHHASADVVMLLLEAAWLLDVGPAAASHQKRGLCLWNTPVLTLRLLAQPVLPAEDEQDEPAAAATAPAEAGAAGQQASANPSKPSEGAATEQPQQPRAYGRQVLYTTQLVYDRVNAFLEKLQNHANELKLLADTRKMHVAAGIETDALDRHYDALKAKEQYHADHAKFLKKVFFDTMPTTVTSLETAARAAQPFTAEELQLLDRQLAACTEAAAKLQQQFDMQVEAQPIQDMQAVVRALHEKLFEQKADVLRILQHPSMAGSLVQLPLQLLQHLQPLTDAQLKQAAVQFSRLDDTVRKLVEVPTMLLQAEQGLHTELLQAQLPQQLRERQQQQSQQRQQEGVWHEYTLELLELAEAYIRCQHLSRVVGLESGQLLAAVVPKSAQQLLHVLRRRSLTAELAALVITRCKALQVLLAETLEQQQAAVDAAAATAAAPGSSHQQMTVGWRQMCSERQQQQACNAAQDGSGDTSSDSSSGSAGLRCDKRHTGYDSTTDDDIDSNSGDDDSVSISSWCSSNSSILDSPGVLLHEKHLAVGSMAVHMLEQAAAWLHIIAVWRKYSEHKASCQLSADAIAQLLDEAVAHLAGDWRHRSMHIAAGTRHFANLMDTSSSDSSASCSSVGDSADTSLNEEAPEQLTLGLVASAACTSSAGAAEGSFGAAASAAAAIGDTTFASDAAAAVSPFGAPVAVGSGSAMMDVLASTMLPLACCMIKSAAHALQLLLPVWQQIAPASTAAAAARGAPADGSRHGSSDSNADSDSGSEDEALPSLKDIASWHQVSATLSLTPAAVAVLAVVPSIRAASQQLPGQQQQQQCSGVAASTETFVDAVEAFMGVLDSKDTTSSTASGVEHAARQVDDGMLASTRSAALSMLCLLPFAYHDVLQAAAEGDVAGAATGLLSPATAGNAALGCCVSAGNAHYTANSSSSSGCAVMAQAGLDGASNKSRRAAGCAAAAAKHSTESNHSSGVMSPPPGSRLQQQSPRSSSGNKYWGCNNAHCVNLSSASERTMPIHTCSGCRSAGYACTYCSAACQHDDWPVHKVVCKARRRLMAGGK